MYKFFIYFFSLNLLLSFNINNASEEDWEDLSQYLSQDKINLIRNYIDYGSDIETIYELIDINGIDIMQIKLVIAVNDIDNDTSPLDKEVNKFDVAPPGTAAITITPIASSGEIFGNINIIIEKATMGKIMI